MLFRRLLYWLLSLLSTLSSLPVAIATGPAGAYERIGPIYQTYRIAVATWGVDQKKILPELDGLKGTHKNGGANFREMINYLDGTDFDEAFYKDEGIDLDDPEPHKTAVHLYYNGKTGLLQLPKIFAGEDKSMASTLAKVRTVLEDAHSEMKEKDKLADIKRFRDRLDVCHIEIVRHRQSEMEGGDNGKRGASKDIKKEWPDAKVKVTETRWEHDDQMRMFAIDIEGTVKDSPPGTFTVEKVDSWVRNYGSNDGDTNAAKKHFNVLKEHRATMRLERHLLGHPGC